MTRSGCRGSCARGWFRSMHVKSFETHRTRALLGARAQLVQMTTRLSNHNGGYSKRSVFCRAQCGACHSIVESKLYSKDDRTSHRWFNQCSLATTPGSNSSVRSGCPRHRQGESDLQIADDSAGDWRTYGTRLCQHGRISRSVQTVESRRCILWSDAATMSVRPDRSQRGHVAAR